MTAPADPVAGSVFSPLAFLRDELGLGAEGMAPGRPAAIVRIAVNCTAVVALAMLYEIPLPAYMAYVVFLISQKEAASTLLTGVVGALAATLAVILSLAIYTLDAGEPALRLPLMALAAFTGMFLVRTATLGPVAFLAGFVLVLSQTLIDGMPTLEALTRLVLWLWVVVMVPATLTVLVNLAVGEDPADLARASALRVMNGLAAALRDGGGAPLDRQRAQAVALIELHQRAGLLNRDLRRRAAGDQALIEILAELLTLYALLPADTPAAVRRELADVCDGCALAFVRSLGVRAGGMGAGGGRAVPPPRPPVLDEATLRSLTPAQRPVVIALADALARLAAGMGERLAGGPVDAAPDRPGDPPRPARPARPLFVPDAFSNPAHTRFALKTTLAVMAAYIIYSALDWRGISTSVTTCFFVALGTLGETVHKLTLRLSGAVIGGALGGVCVVWVLPLMTDIGQLCLLIAAVSALCAWVATGSQRLSYAGMQIAFAFFLGVLQGYGPSTDLTVLRDRVAGILLGNVLITLVFSLLWPVRAIDGARARLAAALRALGQLLADTDGGEDDGRERAGRRLAAIRALADTRHLVSVAAFERPLLPGHPLPRREDAALGPLHRLAAAVFTVADQGDAGDAAADRAGTDRAAADWLIARADALMTGAAGPPSDPPPAVPLAPPLADAPAPLRAAFEARLLLRAEMDNVAAVIS